MVIAHKSFPLARIIFITWIISTRTHQASLFHSLWYRWIIGTSSFDSWAVRFMEIRCFFSHCPHCPNHPNRPKHPYCLKHSYRWIIHPAQSRAFLWCIPTPLQPVEGQNVHSVQCQWLWCLAYNSRLFLLDISADTVTVFTNASLGEWRQSCGHTFPCTTYCFADCSRHSKCTCSISWVHICYIG